MITEQAIRQRSYLIWLREGRPEGRATEHWHKARAELEQEFECQWRTRDWSSTVMPLVSVTHPPRKVIANRISDDRLPHAVGV